MILTLDIGNSNIVAGLFQNNNLYNKYKINTEKSPIKEYYNDFFANIFKNNNIKGTIISSVVPEINENILHILNIYKKKIIFIGEKNINLGISIKNVIKDAVGSDILMNIVGAKERLIENFVVIDIGTATTFDIALKNAEYNGSIIYNGPVMLSQSLHSLCSQLPLIEIKKPNNFMGKNTIEVMQSGIYYGFLGSLKEIITQIKNNFCNYNLSFCLTGGLSFLFEKDLELSDNFFPNLTLEGLNKVWNLNRPNA